MCICNGQFISYYANVNILYLLTTIRTYPRDRQKAGQNSFNNSANAFHKLIWQMYHKIAAVIKVLEKSTKKNIAVIANVS